MRMVFEAVAERVPGRRWRALFEATWSSYERWFLSQGDAARPSYLACRAALARHMPELVPWWQAHVDLAGGGDRAARLLALYRPAPFLAACSQIALPRPEPLLVRNYDYHPELCEGRILLAGWRDGRVLAKNDCLWGALDGLNEHGLAVSLAFGGRSVVGDGFGIPLILRYVLELARTRDEAVTILARVPSHMAYNVTLVDARGDAATVEVAPDRPAAVIPRPIATNHQRARDWERYVTATRSVEREAALEACAGDGDIEERALMQRFLAPPLYATAWERGFGTLYGALYRPGRGEARYFWPGVTLDLSLDRFEEAAIEIAFHADDRIREV